MVKMAKGVGSCAAATKTTDTRELQARQQGANCNTTLATVEQETPSATLR